ncbi:MAG: hypothetical protein KGQ87_03915 [Verrucomicrobia bacterium]|nr:hypothetical protein [Verrucomicrobiota bacterium]
MQDEHDYECGTCETMASHHLSVTTLCKLLRETQRRESCLIVENKRLNKQLDGAISELSDAKVSVEFWIGKIEEADEAAADLKAELEDTRRHWKEDLEEQARLLGMSAERECDLRGKLERERALADRLAEALRPLLIATWREKQPSKAELAFAAWKEARSE